jgi:hypothetical protein
MGGGGEVADRDTSNTETGITNGAAVLGICVRRFALPSSSRKRKPFAFSITSYALIHIIFCLW